MSDYIKEFFDKYSKIVTITTTVVSLMWGLMHYFDQIQKNHDSIAQINNQLSIQDDKVRSLELKIVELSTKIEISSQKCSVEK